MIAFILGDVIVLKVESMDEEVKKAYRKVVTEHLPQYEIVTEMDIQCHMFGLLRKTLVQNQEWKLFANFRLIQGEGGYDHVFLIEKNPDVPQIVIEYKLWNDDKGQMKKDFEKLERLFSGKHFNGKKPSFAHMLYLIDFKKRESRDNWMNSLQRKIKGVIGIEVKCETIDFFNNFNRNKFMKNMYLETLGRSRDPHPKWLDVKESFLFGLIVSMTSSL